MQSKKAYIMPDGRVDREKFRRDIMRQARKQGASISVVLAEFFRSEEFTKHEMGRFALSTSASGNLIEGAAVLIHALGVTSETAENIRVLEDYIGVSTTDPQNWGASWVIDNMMNWPQGTALTSSRSQLAKI